MHPFGLHERDVTYFGFKVQQGYGCGSCHGVSKTLCSQFIDFPIYFYVAVPFQIQSGSICVVLHQDSCCKVLVEGSSINLCHFTCPHSACLYNILVFLGRQRPAGELISIACKNMLSYKFDIVICRVNLLLVALGIFGSLSPIICPVKCCSVQYKRSKYDIFCPS